MPGDANSTSPRVTQGSAALFIGHPGHELRAYGWARKNRPTVSILTDGSGLDGASRVDRTTALLEQIGASRGAIYAPFSDRSVYKAILDGEIARFTSMTEALACEWMEQQIETVATDANEGYCPTHDLCCEMTKAAAELVLRQTGRRIQHFCFRLTELKPEAEEALREDAMRIRLSDEVLAEKIAAARSYVELRREVDQALAGRGADYFRDEWLMPVGGWDQQSADYKPFYEELGERRLAQGTITTVLRYREHMQPIFSALHEYVSAPREYATSDAAAPHAMA